MGPSQSSLQGPQRPAESDSGLSPEPSPLHESTACSEPSASSFAPSSLLCIIITSVTVLLTTVTAGPQLLETPTSICNPSGSQDRFPTPALPCAQGRGCSSPHWHHLCAREVPARWLRWETESGSLGVHGPTSHLDAVTARSSLKAFPLSSSSFLISPVRLQVHVFDSESGGHQTSILGC